MLNRLALFVSLAGMILTLHLWVQKQRGFDQGCWGMAANARLDPSSEGCRAQELEQAGQFLGISTVVLGYLFYFGLAALGFGKIILAPKLARICHSSAECLIVAALPFSAYLFYIQAFVAHAFCPLCLVSVGLVVALTTLFVLQRQQGGFEPVSESDRTREIGYASGLAFGSAGILVILLLFVGQLGTRRLDQGSSAQQIAEVVGRSLPRYVDVNKLREIAPPITKQKIQVIQVADWMSSGFPIVGTNEGPVVMAFFDPNCPHCDESFAAIINLSEQYRDRARFMVLPCALWEFSMLQIQALALAHRENRYFDMWTAQFDHKKKKGLGLGDIEKVFRALKLDTRDLKKRLADEKAATQAFHRKVRTAGIKSTPSIFIDGISTSARSEEALAKAIEETLARSAAKPSSQSEPAPRVMESEKSPANLVNNH